MNFKLKSGNNTTFKMMGSSPLKQTDVETYNKEQTEKYNAAMAKYKQDLKSYQDSTASYQNQLLIEKKDSLFGRDENPQSELKKESNKKQRELHAENVERGIHAGPVVGFDFVKAADELKPKVKPKKPEKPARKPEKILKIPRIGVKTIPVEKKEVKLKKTNVRPIVKKTKKKEKVKKKRRPKKRRVTSLTGKKRKLNLGY